MVIHKSGKHPAVITLTKIFTSVAIVYTPVLIELLFNVNFIGEFYYWIAAGIITRRFIDYTFDKRIISVGFDSTKRQMIFHSKKFFSSKKVTILSFDDVVARIPKKKSGWFSLFSDQSVYLYKGEKTMFELSESKDGFSDQTFRDIISEIEVISPVPAIAG